MDESAISPSQRCKTVHLVRHAQGTHNVEEEEEKEAYSNLKHFDAQLTPLDVHHRAYSNLKHFDAQLTPLGWKQVEDLHKHVQSSGLCRKIDLVVVSPHLRTMQTAVGAFGGEEYTDGINALPLMVANAGGCDHSAISSLNCPPFLAMEKCREQISTDQCNKRRSIKDYRELFPAIDFSLIENNDDILWSADTGETIEDLAARVGEFIKWLWTRKEKEIAIVTHCVFLEHLLINFASKCHSPEKEICKIFANCEIRSLMLVDTGTPGSDSSPTSLQITQERFPGDEMQEM